MSQIYRLTTPITEKQARELRVGDVVYLTGSVFTARDLAHERVFELGDKDEKLPFNLQGGAIWHCGPVTKKDEKGEWKVCSAGPTTSYRLTNETPRMLKDYGVKAIIGKGGMGKPTVDAMKKEGAVFLASTGGCAVIYAEKVNKVINVHWEEEIGLAEAVWELDVMDFGACVVAIDSTGATLYEKIMEKASATLPHAYEQLKVKDPEYRCIHWPPTLAGTKDVAAGMITVGGGA